VSGLVVVVSLVAASAVAFAAAAVAFAAAAVASAATYLEFFGKV